MKTTVVKIWTWSLKINSKSLNMKRNFIIFTIDAIKIYYLYLNSASEDKINLQVTSLILKLFYSYTLLYKFYKIVRLGNVKLKILKMVKYLWTQRRKIWYEILVVSVFRNSDTFKG